VGTANGFLPREPPLEELPQQFAALESLLQRMPIKTRDGGEGLLKHGTFGDTLMKELPDYTAEVEKIEDNQLLVALFRDYTFATSSYLLEPCDLEYRKSKTYGLGRQVLPRKLAVPLSIIAKKIDARPYMEYALSYALYNYGYKDKNSPNPLDYSNLRLIRTFDGSDAEHGFILVHVAMVRYSGDLVKATRQVLDAVTWKDRTAFNDALREMHITSVKINQTMESMWSRSSSQGYNDFRTFIMGTYNQPMFPDGVVYEGVGPEGTQYRGESGANDSMIPTLDNVLQATDQMPSNALTDVLKDFRKYRPGNHNEWLSEVKRRADEVGVAAFAREDPTSTVLYTQNLDMVREFRMRHWNFTKEYIIKYSDHAVGTGGSPIVTWLPNQLSAIMDLITATGSKVDMSQLDDVHKEIHTKVMNTAEVQNRVLKREVEELRKRFPETHSNAVSDYKKK
jgi:indoleamine 2,3-dioxygenase